MARQGVAKMARIYNVYNKNSVAKPRKIRKPPESVTAVISTELPKAGSRPNFSISTGIITPRMAASNRLPYAFYFAFIYMVYMHLISGMVRRIKHKIYKAGART